MKCLTIVGARPQFIKAASISRALLSDQSIEEFLVHTGQHYDQGMSDIFFNELDIQKPDCNLGIGSGLHGQQTGSMLSAIEDILLKERADVVIVYGDTNSTLAGALAAVKLHVPVVHIEAGLRSFNRQMPEEINRVLTDHASDLLMAPTPLAVNNLTQEGIPSANIHLVGDVMYDVALYYADKAEKQSTILNHLNLNATKYILATIHRAENTDYPERLAKIFSILSELSREVSIVLPLHPRTRQALKTHNISVESTDSFRIIDPVGYLDMIMLERNACLIATDSGGVQKEAFFYQVPCITFRDETEWKELVELGWNKLVFLSDVSSDPTQMILDRIGISGTLDEYPYGKGDAALSITRILSDILH